MPTPCRPANPDDRHFLAWVMEEAARSQNPRGVWDEMIPDQHERRSMLAQAAVSEHQSFLHYHRFLIAEVEGLPAAALSGYDPLDATEELLIWAMVEAMDSHHWTQEQRDRSGAVVALVAKVQQHPPPNTWIVEWVATRPEFRGRGLVTNLLEEVLEQGRSRGFRQAHLTIQIGNEAAELAYRKAGFTVVSETTDPDYEKVYGCPGMAGMMCPL